MAARAHGLRKSLTLSESRLWEELRAGRLLGVRFRRQVVLGCRYVPVCSSMPPPESRFLQEHAAT
jgi:very-short-patch-repair endonuclease